MTFFIVSFIAGVLTVLAPCILPLLPVVIGSSASGRSKNTPYIVVGSLGLSIILFTYLLKASTAFIMIPPEFWTYLSGGILTLFGLVLVFPALWERIPGMARLSAGSNQLVGEGFQKKSFWGDVLIGAALGPVFSTCSPTYFVILASVLPVSFALGTVYLLAYVAGLALILLLIAMLGQRFADKLSNLADPHSKVKRGIGVLFLILGIMIMTGLEKKLETRILDSGYFDITKVEQRLLEKTEPLPEEGEKKSENKKDGEDYEKYIEIENPSGFVNSGPITLNGLIGKKVILLDFMTYSCINCQRTFPYLNAWYEKYRDQGLEIVGIHTPEFAFEHDIENVRKAAEEFGLKFPLVLDNDYGTWRAYGNRFWPRKYLIDIYGNIVYDHIGEGKYEETEMKIREALTERAEVLGSGELGDGGLAAESVPEKEIMAGSPETYFGALRNELLGNGIRGFPGEQSFIAPKNPSNNMLYLGGTWNITGEYAESAKDSVVTYKYFAKEVYIVGDADMPTDVEIWQDGKLIKIISVKDSKLYTLIANDSPGEHILELRVKSSGLRFYAFTFG